MDTNTEKENPPTEAAPEMTPETAHHEPASIADLLGDAQPVTADELAGPLADAMPEPTESKQIPGNQSAPEASDVFKTPQPVANPFPDVQDINGKIFDPNLHAVGDDGKPKFNKRGFFVSKNIGRPKGESAKKQSGESVIAGDNKPAPQSAPTGPDRFTLAAESYFGFGINVAAAFLSKDVLPESDEQKKLVTIPLADTLRKHDAQEMEPELRLILGCGVYGFTVYQKPTVKERVLKFLGRKPKPAKEEAETVAP